MPYNNLLLIISIVSLLVTALTVSAFAQSAEKQKEVINQTMQDISKSANQTGESTQQGANQTGEQFKEMLAKLEQTSLREQRN
jgi:TolA-binding protein